MEYIRQHRTLFIVEGVIFILLGLLAMAIPGFFTLATELFIGWLFIFAGAFQTYRAVTARGPGFWPTLLMALVYILIGALLLAYPLTGILSLTMLLSALFVFDGVSKILMGFQLRPLNRWGYMVFSGVLSLFMAMIIWSGWPGTAGWVIGLLVGINMFFFGISLIMLATGSANLPPVDMPNTPESDKTDAAS